MVTNFGFHLHREPPPEPPGPVIPKHSPGPDYSRPENFFWDTPEGPLGGEAPPASNNPQALVIPGLVTFFGPPWGALGGVPPLPIQSQALGYSRPWLFSGTP